MNWSDAVEILKNFATGACWFAPATYLATRAGDRAVEQAGTTMSIAHGDYSCAQVAEGIQ